MKLEFNDNLKRRDLRLRAIKERLFEESGSDAPIKAIIIGYFIAACALLAVSLILLYGHHSSY